jgi:hypothetical protein
MSIDFATFDISELTVLDATDALGLPEMGASVIIESPSPTPTYTPELDDMLGDIGGQATISSSSSSSSCCC